MQLWGFAAMRLINAAPNMSETKSRFTCTGLFVVHLKINC